MIKKIIVLSVLIAFNTALIISLSSKEDYRLCKGFKPGGVLAFSGMSIGGDSGGTVSLDFGWDVIICCKTASEMAWCDFSLENPMCKSVVKRDANPFCLTGAILD